MSNYYKQKTISQLFIFMVINCLIKTSYSICNTVNCPPLRGICKENQCICENGFITVNNKIIQNNGVNCNYHLKNRIVAFLLEFFFPFGAGHFYSGKSLLAVIKLFLFIFLICMCCSVLCCVAAKNANTCSVILCAIVFLCIISLALMEIFNK